MPRPTDALMGSKPKNYKKAIRRLISDLRPLLGTFVFVIIILITSATLSVLMPILLRDFMNTFMDPASGYISYDPVAGIFP
ncbi:MAG: hypothetical protein PHT30_03730, partial [Bacilli bacterium]|nr:hypothetical protein [Bacilli bacterium]